MGARTAQSKRCSWEKSQFMMEQLISVNSLIEGKIEANGINISYGVSTYG